MAERPLNAGDIRRVCAGVHFMGLLKPLSWLMNTLLRLPDKDLEAEVRLHAREQFGIIDMTVDPDRSIVVLHYKE